MTNHSLVPSSLYEMTSERIASSLARPPALRITWASPSARPAYLAGSSLASMQVRMAKPRAGGRASSPLVPKDAAYRSFGLRTSCRTATDLSSWVDAARQTAGGLAGGGGTDQTSEESCASGAAREMVLHASHVSAGMMPCRISTPKIRQPMQNAKIDSSPAATTMRPSRICVAPGYPRASAATAAVVTTIPMAWGKLWGGPGTRLGGPRCGATTLVASCPRGLSLGPVRTRAMNPSEIGTVSQSQASPAVTLSASVRQLRSRTPPATVRAAFSLTGLGNPMSLRLVTPAATSSLPIFFLAGRGSSNIAGHPDARDGG